MQAFSQEFLNNFLQDLFQEFLQKLCQAYLNILQNIFKNSSRSSSRSFFGKSCKIFFSNSSRNISRGFLNNTSRNFSGLINNARNFSRNSLEKKPLRLLSGISQTIRIYHRITPRISPEVLTIISNNFCSNSS